MIILIFSKLENLGRDFQLDWNHKLLNMFFDAGSHPSTFMNS